VVTDPNTPRINPWTALLRILTDPLDTFERLGTRPAILPAYLLQMVTGLAGAWMVLPLTLQALQEVPAGTLTAEQMAMVEKTATAMALVEPLVVPWITGGLLALVAAFVAQFMGGSLGLRPYFGMVGYARVPLAINTLLTSFLASRADSLAEAATMSLSPAAFLPAGSSPYATALLGMINPFGIWYYVLLALGFAALHRNRPAQGAPLAGVVFLINLAGALISAALASTRSLLQP